MGWQNARLQSLPRLGSSRKKHESVSKMEFNREINQLFNMFRRSWKPGAKATLNLTTEKGVLKAALELELGKLNDAHPDVTAGTGGLLEAGAQPVRRHPRARAQEKSRLRAARYQAVG